MMAEVDISVTKSITLHADEFNPITLGALGDFFGQAQELAPEDTVVEFIIGETDTDFEVLSMTVTATTRSKK